MKQDENFAFPFVVDDISTKQFTYPGLTKRELFAAMAMQGLSSILFPKDSDVGKLTSTEWSDKMAKVSVEYANALIKALEE